jgi:hypothetical protein
VIGERLPLRTAIKVCLVGLEARTPNTSLATPLEVPDRVLRLDSILGAALGRGIIDGGASSVGLCIAVRLADAARGVYCSVWVVNALLAFLAATRGAQALGGTLRTDATRSDVHDFVVADAGIPQILPAAKPFFAAPAKLGPFDATNLPLFSGAAELGAADVTTAAKGRVDSAYFSADADVVSAAFAAGVRALGAS